MMLYKYIALITCFAASKLKCADLKFSEKFTEPIYHRFYIRLVAEYGSIVFVIVV